MTQLGCAALRASVAAPGLRGLEMVELSQAASSAAAAVARTDHDARVTIPSLGDDGVFKARAEANVSCVDPDASRGRGARRKPLVVYRHPLKLQRLFVPASIFSDF
jgi:hypothetical protein